MPAKRRKAKVGAMWLEGWPGMQLLFIGEKTLVAEDFDGYWLFFWPDTIFDNKLTSFLYMNQVGHYSIGQESF